LLGEDDLSAVCHRRHPRSLMYRECDVLGPDRRCQPHVHAHPNSDLDTFRPALWLKRSLPLGACPRRVADLPEGDEEAVPLRVDLVAAVRCPSPPQQLLVPVQNVGVAVAETAQKPGRALYVREDERNDARRQGW